MPLLGSARSIRAIVKRRCLKRDVLPNISSTMVPTAVLLSCFFIILFWRKAHVRWSILANHLIYGVNAWANVWTHICGSFGEKLSVYSFTSTYYIVTVFTSETGGNWHIREQMCLEADLMMVFGCVDFTIDIMIFAHHLNPFLGSSGLIMEDWYRTWCGQLTRAQTSIMSALISISHLVSQSLCRRLDGLFPPFLESLLWAAAPFLPPSPVNSKKA